MKQTLTSILNKITPILIKPIAISIIFFIIGTIIIVLIFLPSLETNKKEQYYNIYTKALNISSRMEYELYKRINFSQALSSHIEQNYNITQKQFSSFVASLLRNDNGVISSMSNAKDFNIHLIAPYEVNKKALGLDLTLKPELESNFKKCISEHKTYTEGPSRLAQGGVGIILYTPVYIQDTITNQNKLYGVTGAVLLWNKFIEAAKIKQYDDIDIAIRGINGTGEKGELFYGDSTLFHKEQVIKIPIKLPAGEWILAAYPKQGWHTNIDYFIYLMLSITISSLILYFLLRYNLKRITETERKYHFILDNTKDSIWSMNFDTLSYTYISKPSIKTSGYTPSHIVGRAIGENMDTDTYKKIISHLNEEMEYYKKGIKNEVQKTFEIQIFHSDGTPVWIEISANVVFDKQGKPSEIVGRTTRIDDRKKLELALKESENRYSVIANNVEDIIFACNINLVFTYINSACYKFLGYTIEEIKALHLSSVVTQEGMHTIEDSISKELKKFQETPTEHPQMFFEIQMVRKDGALIWTEVSAKIIASNGELSDIIGIVRNINERKILERKLVESEKRYNVIVNNVKDIIWTCDFETLNFTYSNSICYELLGYTSAELTQLNVSHITSDESFTFIYDMLELEIKKFYSDKTQVPQAFFEVQLYKKDRTLSWFEMSARIIVSEDNELMEIIGIARNIDERKKYEQQILEQQKELKALNTAKDRFLAIIAHDLKNPFAALLNISEGLKNHYYELKDEEIVKYINIIYGSANHAFSLLSSLLEWARSSMNSIQYEVKKTNFYELVQRALQTCKAISIVKKIHISIEHIPRDIYVMCDTDRIETVLRNIVSNAIKFSHIGSIIVVNIEEYAQDPLYYLISIKDSGVGIPPEQISKIFKIDEKIITKGTNNESGTGLGLVLCKEFIDKHNCKIWVESELGKGTTVFLTLNKYL